MENVSQEYIFRVYTCFIIRIYIEIFFQQSSNICLPHRNYSELAICMFIHFRPTNPDNLKIPNSLICVHQQIETRIVRLFHYLYDRWEAPDAGSSDAGESWNSGSQYRFFVARIDRLPTSCYTPKYRDNGAFRSNRKSHNCRSYYVLTYICVANYF